MIRFVHKPVSVMEVVISFAIFTGIVLSIAVGLGTMTCGWHLVDDHEYLEWLNLVNSGQMSWGELLYSVWWNDFGARFRPLYFPYRVFLTSVFGANINAYGALRTIETVLALVLLYFAARCTKADRICSFLFSMLSMTGYQAAVWWKLGPQEEECTILLALGMILIEKWLDSGRTGLMAGAFCSFVCMGLFHESFILVVPFIICYVLLRSGRKYGVTGTLQQRISGLKKIPAAGHAFMLGMMLYLIAVMVIIVFFVGTNNYSGAGVSFSISPWQFATSYFYAIGGDLKYYFWLGLPLTGILLTYWDEVKSLKAEFLLLLLFVVPQLILFGKESMGERYILPMIIGLCWFFLIIIPQHHIVRAKRGIAYWTIILALLVLGYRSTRIEANYYRFRGQSVTEAMTFASDQAKKSGVKVFSMLGYSNPEADQTLDAWMIYHGVGDDIYYWNENDGQIQKIRPYLDPDGTVSADNTLSLDQFDVAIAYNNNDRHYTGKSLPVRDGTMDQYYTKVTCGSLDIYIRNGSGIEIPEIDITL